MKGVILMVVLALIAFQVCVCDDHKGGNAGSGGSASGGQPHKKPAEPAAGGGSSPLVASLTSYLSKINSDCDQDKLSAVYSHHYKELQEDIKKACPTIQK